MSTWRPPGDRPGRGGDMAGIPELKRFFRAAGGIDVDKADVRRFQEFVDERVDDLAVAGRDVARWNGRDVIAPQDLPITSGLQEQIRAFGKLEEADEIRQLLRRTVRRPPGDVTFGEDTEDVLVEVFGGISVALARSFRLPAGRGTTPTSEPGDRALGLSGLLVCPRPPGAEGGTGGARPGGVIPPVTGGLVPAPAVP